MIIVAAVLIGHGWILGSYLRFCFLLSEFHDLCFVSHFLYELKICTWLILYARRFLAI
jgi:hypothetical protein